MIEWHEPKDSNEFLTFEDVDKMMKSYNPTEFRQQYLNEPEPSKALFDKLMDYARQLTSMQRLKSRAVTTCPASEASTYST